MKTIIRYIFVVITFMQISDAQDLHFSQFFSTPLYLSPSLTGATNDTRIIINYRNQWPAIPNSFINYSFSIDHFLKKYKSGIGVLILKSNEGGVYYSSNCGLTYTYMIQLNNIWKLNPGIRFSYFSSNLEWNNLQFGDQMYRNSVSSIEIPKDERVNYYDFSGSLLLYNENMWFGFTLDHLLDVNQQFTTEPNYPSLKYSVYGGIKLLQQSKKISDPDKSYTLAFLYKDQDGYHQLDLGAYYEREYLRIGLWIRGATDYLGHVGLNSIIMLMGYNYKQIKINYSYDVSTARLMTLTGGAHEISLMYKINWNGYNKKAKRKALPCPDF